MILKRLFYSFLISHIIFLSSCSSPTEKNESAQTETETVSVDLILGKWQLDSSRFINNERYSKATPPVMETVWLFEKNGSYKVQNSLEMPGTYSRTYDSLFVVLMGVPNNYEILTLTESYLTLQTTIIENDSTSVKTEAFLSRHSN